MGNKIKKHIEFSLPVKTIIGISLSCIIGIVFSLLLSVFFSYILSKSPEISKFISAYFIISVLSGAFACGFAGSKLLDFKGIVSGIICSFPFSAIIFTIMFLVSDGKLSVYSMMLFLFIVVLCAAGGIVSANMKRRK